MSILEDIVEEVEIEPAKHKPILKWIVRIAVILIGLAFAFGGFKQTAIFQLKEYETQVNTNTNEIKVMKDAIDENKKEIKENIKTTNTRLDAFDVRLDNNSERLENHIYSDEIYQNRIRKIAIKKK